MGGSTVLPFAADCPSGSMKPEGESKDIDDVLLIAKSSEILDNTDLHFESRFESGNLCKVVKITDTYYQLYLRKDLYTQRHTQWYYFRISNTRSRTTYR